MRQRKDDIPILVNYFLNYFTSIHKKEIAGIKESALTLLEEHEWPGNIRQLQNEIERAVIICSEKWLNESHFKHLSILSGESKDDALSSDFNKSVDEYKYNLIHKALLKNGNNWTKAAEQLKLSRQSMKRMYEKIKEEQNL